MTIQSSITDNGLLRQHLKWNSYLSNRYKILYVSTPKVACTSLKWWFASIEGYTQVLRASSETEESDPDLAIHDNFHKVAPHVTGLDLESLSEALTSDAYFRFAIVRNPYKRIFSAWQSKLLLREPLQIVPYVKSEFFHHPIERASDIVAAFEMFLEHLASNEAPSFWDRHWSPQAALLRPDLINYSKLTKIENAGELSKALGEWLDVRLPDPFALRRANESLIPYLPEVISERSGELIRSLYVEDFEAFGYSLQPPLSTEAFTAEQLGVAIRAVRLIRGRHQLLGERTAQVKALNHAAADRAAQVASLSQAVAQCNEDIASLGKTITQRNEEVTGLMQIVAERDAQIASLNQAVIQRNEEVASFGKAIAQRDEEAARLRQVVAERDAQIEILNQAVIQRNDEVASLGKAIAQRDEETAGLMQVIAERDTQIASLNHAVAEGKKQNQALTHDSAQLLIGKDHELHTLQRELTRVLQSRSWRVTASLRKLAAPGRCAVSSRRESGEYLGILGKLRLKSAIRQIHASALFDADYYLATYPDVRNAQLDPATHYLVHGWKEHRNPSVAFDTAGYLAANPDVAAAGLNPLSHYLKHGQKEGRAWESDDASHPINSVGVTATDESIRNIVASPYFDTDYYSKAAGLSFETRIAAVQHYVSKGEGSDLRPSNKFDPYTYRTSNPDLAGFGQPLLVHYINHGAAEGRAAVFEVEYFDGEQPFDGRRKTILVAIHELSQTGAPILGLNLVMHLSRDYNIICVTGRNGTLRTSFRKHVHKLIAPASGSMIHCAAEVVARCLMAPLNEQYGIQAALVNSVEAAVFARACYFGGIPVVSLIHEFSEYIFPKHKINSVIESSQRVVFSSSIIENSALSSGVFGGEFKNSVIIPQGKLQIPSEFECISPLAKDAMRKVSDERRFLVIGCGFVQIRKGVDLFIAAASHVVEALGARNVCFLWVGEGYAPEVPGDYSNWLKDQVCRAGLEDVVCFIPAVGGSDLESLYRQADVMLLSSRLDPFPNVAIDAMSVGLPIVCFDKATGVAEYLRNIGGTESLVVPYLDVRAAAEAIIRLQEAPQARNLISAQLKDLAESRFNFHSYAEKIESLLGEAVESNEQEIQDVEQIAASQFFQADSFNWPSVNARSRLELIRQYVRLSAAGGHYPVPRPFAGLSPEIYAQASNLPSSVNPLAQWLRDGRPAGRWLRDVIELQGHSRKSALQVALHIHLHYYDEVEDILSRLQVNETKPDLFLTVTSEEAVSQIQPQLSDYGGEVAIIKVPNRGRDIASMLTVLSGELQKYDFVGHLHVKKSPHFKAEVGMRDPVVVWSEFLYENLIGSKIPALDLIAAYFEANPKVGLVFPEDPYVCGWGMNLEIAQAVADRLKCGTDLPDAIEFPVGNMFFARPNAIKPLLTANFALDDFPDEPVPVDGTILHALERMTPIICENEGYDWRTTSVLGVTR
ncbi:rhamnan synthesis F family protein [Mesorhizobium sp.]|uniref:rhamnan synthesis F family protein n=1 Tax=Mesorhizobium sp. TaxID=1871066 RepID=UPI0025F04D98|nr:rhamnan synthesis F family protein [Mesorhizobium sp.]